MSPALKSTRGALRLGTLIGTTVLCASPALSADLGDSTFDIYGFAMLDMGYESGQSDPNWFDAARPTKLPSFDNEFGEDGHFYSGVRQSRLGFKSLTPTSMGDLKTTFEFELYGVGADAGQTTIRLRHAYGELGQFGAGQTWSPFMDIDVFPNSVEYWGPTGMAFYRNVQVRWMPIQGDTRLTIALERPGASADGGDYDDRIALNGVKARFDLPDLSAEYRFAGDWGYVEAAGILRKMQWDDTIPGTDDLSGSATGWGINLSSNLNVGNAVFRLAVVFGEGIQNYMNDATVDVGAVPTGDPTHSVDGEPLPMVGITAFVDYKWNDTMSTAFGYSSIDMDNSVGQSPSAFKKGQYALANVMFTPVKNVMFGPEVIWIRRENNSDGFSVDDVRFQFSAKYNFGITFGGN
jgi:DcaP outer membrane protein